MKYLKLVVILILYGLFSQSSPIIAEKKANIIIKYNQNVETMAMQKDKAFKLDVLSVPESEKDEWIDKLNDNPDVQYVESDQTAHLLSSKTNDPFYESQSLLFDQINVTKAWETYRPLDTVVVGVVDSGIDLNHPDLQTAIVGGKNFIHEGEPPLDHDGHGTHVAGLIGAATNNSVGVSSIGKNVKLMPIKVFEGNTTSMSTVIKGIEYAVDQGVDVINLSLGSYSNMKSLEDVVQYASSKGVIVVGASGNDNDDMVVFPAVYPNVLGVGSVDTSTLKKAEFSNFGPSVDVVAPGTDVLSTGIGRYINMEGTSMSTGIVSSIAAMIKQQAPYLTGHQVMKIIEDTSQTTDENYSLGKGLVNADAALKYIHTKNRLAGANSVSTSVEISKEGWRKLDEKELAINNQKLSGKFVILASGDTFADSLAASPLASYLDSPILLVKQSRISEKVLSEIKRLGADHIVIVGGEEALSGNVEKELRGLEVSSHRLFGETRYETNLAINKTIPFNTNKAFIVSGEDYPDALSIASYSGVLKYPIIFTKKDSLAASLKQYIRTEEITKVYVIGGEAVISKTVENTLPSPYRISGEDRYSTNKAIQDVFGKQFNSPYLFYATGENYPDALTAGPLASRLKSPVLLVGSAKADFEWSTKLFSDKKGYFILGGEDVIPSPMAWKIDRLNTN
ncbi:S8 family serine peptidase [Rossellomorea arthrocnemi]